MHFSCIYVSRISRKMNNTSIKHVHTGTYDGDASVERFGFFAFRCIIFVWGFMKLLMRYQSATHTHTHTYTHTHIHTHTHAHEYWDRDKVVNEQIVMA